MTAKEENKPAIPLSDIRVVEEIYQLADRIAESAGSTETLAQKGCAYATERLNKELQTHLKPAPAVFSAPPNNSWILDVMVDLADFADQNGLEHKHAD